MSRWITPCECANSSAARTCVMIDTLSRTVSRPSRFEYDVEVFAVDELHRQKRRPRLLAVIEEGHDVGMQQPAGGTRLLAKAVDAAQ